MNINRFKKKLPQVVSAIFFFSFLVFLSSCNDLPTDVGSVLVGDTVNIKVLTNLDTTLLYATSIPNYSPSALNATKILCGRAHDIETISIIRFGYLPDSLDYLTEDDIVSSELFMYPRRYALGDTLNANFGFKLKKVENYWGVQANWDSISVPGFFGREVGSYSGPIKLQDTMDRIKIDLEKKLITDWFKLRTDTVAAVVNWGIAMVPDANSNVVYTFGGEGISSSSSSNNPPIIKVVYKNKNKQNALDSIYLYTGINASFVNYPKFPNDEIVIQSGLDVQTLLHFDLSMIPTFSGIAKMELELTLNKDKSYFGNLKPKEYFRIDFVSDSLGAKSSNYYFADKLDSNSSVYKCSSITSAAELWNRYSGKGKLIIRGADLEQQFQRLDKFVFYGLDDPDLDKRPRVRVVYSTQTKH